MEFEPTSSHECTIIFLHGRDSTAQEFAAEFFESQASDNRTFQECLPGARWVFPTANMVASKRFGMDLSQWYDMQTTEDPQNTTGHEQQLDASARRICHIIRTEAAAVGGHQRVFVGGISQGSTTALRALLLEGKCLAGFVGLSSWLPTTTTCEYTKAHATPVLLSHSMNDDVINITNGRDQRDALVEAGMQVQWCQYQDGGHWVHEPRGVGESADSSHVHELIIQMTLSVLSTAISRQSNSRPPSTTRDEGIANRRTWHLRNHARASHIDQARHADKGTVERRTRHSRVSPDRPLYVLSHPCFAIPSLNKRSNYGCSLPRQVNQCLNHGARDDGRSDRPGRALVLTCTSWTCDAWSCAGLGENRRRSGSSKDRKSRRDSWRRHNPSILVSFVYSKSCAQQIIDPTPF